MAGQVDKARAADTVVVADTVVAVPDIAAGIVARVDIVEVVPDIEAPVGMVVGVVDIAVVGRAPVGMVVVAEHIVDHIAVLRMLDLQILVLQILVLQILDLRILVLRTTALMIVRDLPFPFLLSVQCSDEESNQWELDVWLGLDRAKSLDLPMNASYAYCDDCTC